MSALTAQEMATGIHDAIEAAGGGKSILLTVEDGDIVATRGDHVTEVIRFNGTYTDGDRQAIAEPLKVLGVHAKLR